MSKINRQLILEKAIPVFAFGGRENFSIRKFAQYIPISPSVIYHYFRDEEDLLQQMFDFTNHRLGVARAQQPLASSAAKMLRDRINFQFDHGEEVVAVLKYYLSHRKNYPLRRSGFLPPKSTLHIEEVLNKGQQNGEFHLRHPQEDAQVITHAINGFLLEYYPHLPQGRQKALLVSRLYRFLVRALKGGDYQ